LCSLLSQEVIFLIWVIPFLALFCVVDCVSTFHHIPLIPAFCNGAAAMITDLSDKITKNKKLVRRILPTAIISVIGFSGLTSMTSMHDS
jgi:dolichyl-phosphate-mannose--protein O-mannosyl transferase